MPLYRPSIIHAAMSQSSQKKADSLFLPPDSPLFSSEDDQDTPKRGRQKPWTSLDAQYQQVPPEDQDIAEHEEGQEHPRIEELELDRVPRQTASIVTIKRVPVASRAYLSLAASAAESSTSVGNQSQASADQHVTGGTARSGISPSPQSSRCSLEDDTYQQTTSQVDLLAHEHGIAGCPMQGDLVQSRWTRLRVLIIVMSLYSTFFSSFFLTLAAMKPRWGYRIGTQGAMSYDTATLLSALISKTVELTFATTFVATLGQILSRRAFAKSALFRDKPGISLAEANMRLWIMQPGTVFTHWHSSKLALKSILGVSVLLAAVCTAFYTTAVEALVSPKLKFGRNETLTMFGDVKASYANAVFLADSCQTLLSDMDPIEAGNTCLQIEYAGNSFHNLNTWLATWDERRGANTGADTSSDRPPPVAMLYENTTVHGQWIWPSGDNIRSDLQKHERLVQNISMVMPHANVVRAAKHWKNGILQPNDLRGAGEYYIKAAVPGPGINVLCVGASFDELQPLIKNSSAKLSELWPSKSTPLDSIFNWTQTLPETTAEAHALWFADWPLEFNTIVNEGFLQTNSSYGSDFVYLLGKPPSSIVTNDYALCGLRSFQYTNCSTAYHVTSSGGQLSVHCDDDIENHLSYRSSKVNGSEIALMHIEKDWTPVGQK